jgi:hypothetical protein
MDAELLRIHTNLLHLADPKARLIVAISAHTEQPKSGGDDGDRRAEGRGGAARWWTGGGRFGTPDNAFRPRYIVARWAAVMR